jgi:partitioning defective protein 6
MKCTNLFFFSFQFDAEFRRFSLDFTGSKKTFEEFYSLLEDVHSLRNIPFIVCYTDPEGDLLPINNDDNYLKALSTAKPLLRILIQRRGQSYCFFFLISIGSCPNER